MKKIKNKKLKPSSQRWVNRNIKDLYVNKAISLGYRSRSAFKLLEINKKFNFLKENSNLLDLGSSPGGWAQVASEKIKRGKVLAVDVLNMKNINNVHFLCGDFMEQKTQNHITKFFSNKIDIITSDMAANTTGNKNLDSYRTNELCLTVINFSKEILNLNGVLICKCFMGAEFQGIAKEAAKIFDNVINFKPISSRNDSRELYLYCRNMTKQL